MELDKTTKAILTLLEQTKGEDIELINVSELTPFSEYYLLVTASNIRQMNAIKETVLKKLKELEANLHHVEGREESGWVLIDAHHLIVNIFTKEERERISLEEIFKRRN
ncbi:MAG: ribosome silencing factor [Bacilli bacterium]|nr:ribosome silencing factor [Bacilli bacterium]NLN80475.1 ribosome silencing factor [Erysipelotrichia bacterium]